jgi:hypothetical protein
LSLAPDLEEVVGGWAGPDRLLPAGAGSQGKEVGPT